MLHSCYDGPHPAGLDTRPGAIPTPESESKDDSDSDSIVGIGVKIVWS